MYVLAQHREVLKFATNVMKIKLTHMSSVHCHTIQMFGKTLACVFFGRFLYCIFWIFICKIVKKTFSKLESLGLRMYADHSSVFNMEKLAYKTCGCKVRRRIWRQPVCGK